MATQDGNVTLCLWRGCKRGGVSPEWRASGASCAWRRRSCTPPGALGCSRPPGTCCRRRRWWGWAARCGAAGYWCSTHSAGKQETAFEHASPPRLTFRERSFQSHRTGNKPSSKWGSSPSMKEKTSTHWIYIHEICTFIQPSWPKAASPETRQRTAQRRSSLLIQGRKKGRKPGYLCPGITTNCFLQGQFIAHKELTKAENHWQELFWRVL